MKALYKPAPAAGLELVDRPEPETGPADVKIRVLRTGICGTDLHIERWDDWAAAEIQAPLIPGHEFYGEVVEVGELVHDVAVGDHVSGEGHIVCGMCRNCRAGRRQMCIRTKGVGLHRDGAFAEYVVIPGENVWVHHCVRRARGRRDLRPVRQRRAHRARVLAGRRGRARHGLRPHRPDVDRGRPPRRRALHRRERREPRSPRARPADGGGCRGRRVARAHPRRAAEARHARGLRRRVRDERSGIRPAPDDREHEPRRPHRAARPRVGAVSRSTGARSSRTCSR